MRVSIGRGQSAKVGSAPRIAPGGRSRVGKLSARPGAVAQWQTRLQWSQRMAESPGALKNMLITAIWRWCARSCCELKAVSCFFSMSSGRCLLRLAYWCIPSNLCWVTRFSLLTRIWVLILLLLSNMNAKCFFQFVQSMELVQSMAVYTCIY